MRLLGNHVCEAGGGLTGSYIADRPGLFSAGNIPNAIIRLKQRVERDNIFKKQPIPLLVNVEGLILCFLLDLKMEEIFREYKDSDYEQCEELVNQAWGFDRIFSPKALSDLAKLIYTKGSVLGSNYKVVIEVNGKVAGFIFGLNECSKKPGRSWLFGLGILWKLLRIKGDKPDKKDLITAIKIHEKNRADIVDRGRSEIVLFVVGNAHQKKGGGKRLWAGFKSQCVESGVKSIVVETNKLGASGFYECIGFEHLGDFDSPLHEFATKGGQACMYEYACQ